MFVFDDVFYEGAGVGAFDCKLMGFVHLSDYEDDKAHTLLMMMSKMDKARWLWWGKNGGGDYLSHARARIPGG